ncbi:DUF1697 domain-containing protein [Primorskyibacter sp. 2E233]|uniref:DUF1697 domain-containing protein n=1 Tax=Primorskyibacter sp. 2E233 TaxID=3413431 RepID=UPI003BF29A03
MTRFCALLRAVNVGGTGKLPMADLRAMCTDLGFADVQTYIASGNVVFSSDAAADAVKSALEARLESYAGQSMPVMLRDADQMRAVLDAIPFAGADPKQVVVLFLDTAPGPNALEARHQKDEVLRAGAREVYVYYPSGMGSSKLTYPAMKLGTARNLNTLRKLVDLLHA